ncbi:MAG: CRISPR-associated helicase Cas3' [Anaerolineae bacterium]|nr:CRISPR-associated helicase Cas3' [Anaerolineae bacterium]
MSRGMTKAERLREMERLYVQHREGLTDAELAERCGVDRTTIFRDRRELECEVPFNEVEPGRWAIDRMEYLSSIRVDLTEALALYLAARRAARHTRTYQAHVVSALEKLAAALREPMTEHLVQAAAAIARQSPQPECADVLETLTRAWAERTQVKMSHRALGAKDARHYVFSPYLIEPSLWSDAIYTIGHSDFHGGLATFKVERIEEARLLIGQHFTLPDTFDEETLFRFAWGIWHTDEEPATVKLRFMGRIAVTRLKESIWHPTQTLADETDGSCVWTAQVAEWQEMLPWVRGWGASVEVLEPEEMREALVREVRRMGREYGVSAIQSNPQQERLLQCWGKTDRWSEQFHPALFHLLDVGFVARVLLQPPASPRWRRVLGQTLGAKAETLHEWLPYFVALHDIGKFSAPFQGAREGQRKRLERLGFTFSDRANDHHTAIGQVCLAKVLNDLALPETLRDVIVDTIGGHHGRFAGNEPAKMARHYLETYEPSEWRDLRAIASAALKQHLLLSPPTQWPEPTNVSAAIMALTGFTILCDWLGSDSARFPLQPDVTLEEYLAESQGRAHAAAESAGFFAITESQVPTSFAELFPDKQPTRPLQAAIDAVPADLLAGPCLAILEAPTGEGKTEAALALAHRLAQARDSDELYYALPTTATSNQMFKRLQTHLRDRLELETQVKLIHGQAFLIEDDWRLEPLDDLETDHREAALEWFGPKKRALLAPFGVGTIDQIELATLNVKHTALRMIGLAGKVIILDEVHAYDTYMTTVIESLLRWLRALDTSVILLSATLPQSRRAALARAYGVDIGGATAAQAYPGLWIFGAGEPYHAELEAMQPDRTLALNSLHWGDGEVDTRAKAHWLLDAVADSGCVCWMVNTVRRAQAIFEAVDQLAEPGIDRMLLHAQLPLFERERREAALSEKYGPPDDKTQRPERGIVVGTQVLEQSLDLDFDVLVSDLAPIDLLLQRAGRLHRHVRSGRNGPPYLCINVPLTAEGLPLLDLDRWVYAPFLLLQTWAILVDRTEIVLPRDYRLLVEAVYGLEALPADHPFAAEWQDLKRKEKYAVGEANIRLLPEPDPEWAFSSRMGNITFEESENSAAWIVGKTRLGEESVTVIPMERREDVAWGWPDGVQVALGQAAPRETQLDLLRRQLRISNRDAIAALKMQGLPALFTHSTLLKDYLPLWLTDGAAELSLQKGVLEVSLDEKLGLQIRKKGA